MVVAVKSQWHRLKKTGVCNTQNNWVLDPFFPHVLEPLLLNNAVFGSAPGEPVPTDHFWGYVKAGEGLVPGSCCRPAKGLADSRSRWHFWPWRRSCEASRTVTKSVAQMLSNLIGFFCWFFDHTLRYWLFRIWLPGLSSLLLTLTFLSASSKCWFLLTKQLL